MDKGYVAFDWNTADKQGWLDPCEESYYYAEKWRREGRESVLDLGCGLGRHSVLFAKYGFKVTAADISSDALDFLKGYSKEQGADVACRLADMEALPFADDAFDCIFAMHSAGHADSAGMERIMGRDHGDRLFEVNSTNSFKNSICPHDLQSGARVKNSTRPGERDGH